ncbi:MAG: bifunctional diguanylate cyclase/phosphodiesterase [Mobilitalea sp.]
MDKTMKKLEDINPLLNDDKFLHFLTCGQIAIIYLDKTGCIQFVTPSITTITGISLEHRGEYLGRTIFAEYFPEISNNIADFISSIHMIETSNSKRKRNTLKKYQVELELNGRDNIIYRMTVRSYISDNMQVKGIILIFNDITKIKLNETVLKVEKEKYRIVAELTESALWEYDIKKKELRQYRKLKGRYSNNNLIIKDYRNTIIKNGWIHPEDAPIFEAYCDSMDHGDNNIRFELRAMGDNDEYIWLRYQGSPLKDPNGDVNLIMGRTLNIDNEYKNHERLILKTQRDALTGLYNRATTKEKAEKCFERCNHGDQSEVHNYMIIDIDNFKQANDQWGHLFGDSLLESFAKHLEKLFETTDVVGRLGGDEFVVLQKGIKDVKQIEQSAAAICEIARKHMNSLSPDNTITVSVGIATYPKDGRNYDTLYRKADMALYIAKSKGKNQYTFYEPEMENLQRIAEDERRHWIARNIFDKDSTDIDKRLLNIALDIANESFDLNYSINHILHEIGKFYDLSRITVFENKIGSMESGINFEWENSKIPSTNYVSVKNTAAVMKNFNNIFCQNGMYYFNDVTTSGATPELMLLYKKLGTKALVQCAIYDVNEFIGIINYEDCVAARNWSKSEIGTLYSLTKLISIYIIHSRSKQELHNEVFFTKATLNNQKLSNYAINEGSYELQYFSEYTENQFPDIMLGDLCYKAIHGKDAPCDPCPLRGLNEMNNRYSIEAYNEVTDTWYSTTASTETMPNGDKINIICSSDVTGFIDRVNSKDALTGLLTLSKFEAEGMKLIAGNSNSMHLIIYCDFDKFKNINDEWGYSIGNEALVYFAKTAGKFISPSELFCRIAADEFVMMLSYDNKLDAVERIRNSYQLIAKEFKIKYAKFNPVMTCGIYFLSKEDKVLSIAIDKANLVRKSIKGIHKSNYAIYDDSLHLQVTKEKLIENSMYKALRNNEFVVYMQPKIDLSTTMIIGAEALVRWRLSSGEVLGAIEFIPIFEKNGFIEELDFYVYEMTFQAIRQCMDIGKSELVVSMNVSRIHLNDSNFLERLDALVEKYMIPTRLIELEITESMFFVEPDRLLFIINNLRKRGFVISIDDFGSGYSSLNLLKTLPVDILKLDREFFMSNVMENQDKIVISSIISLAKGLGLKVISEGVETADQLAFLKESYCDMAQGFLFYKPLPMEEFIELLD